MLVSVLVAQVLFDDCMPILSFYPT